MSEVVFVGGGIASLFGATLMARQGFEVTILEREPRVGGLLNSWQSPEGDWFDFGTHFIAGTNRPEVDEIILPADAVARWQRFDNERGGNFFAGHYSEGCLFVDTRALPEDHYAAGVADYLAAVEGQSAGRAPGNVEDQLVDRFGATFADRVFRPALTKLYGVGLEELVPDAHLRFGMKRLKAFSADETRRLKQDPDHDDRLCFHEYREGQAARHQHYPRTGGAGEWVRALADQAEAEGVEIRCSTTVAAIERAGRRVTGVVDTAGDQRPCDTLVWTVPLFPLLRMLDVRTTGGPPRLRQTSLFHLVFDEPPIPTDHFFFCYDPDYVTFRATLYSNLQPEQSRRSGRHRVTVETLTDGALPVDATLDRLVGELTDMGVLPSTARVLDRHATEVREGFPVLDQSFEQAKRAQIAAASEALDNLLLVGRACTDAWFMHEVFVDVWEKLAAFAAAAPDAARGVSRVE